MTDSHPAGGVRGLLESGVVNPNVKVHDVGPTARDTNRGRHSTPPRMTDEFTRPRAVCSDCRRIGRELGRGVAGARSPGRLLQWMIGVALLLLFAPQPALADDLSRGVDLFYQERYEEAIPYLKQASARHPNDPDVLAWLAETYRRARWPDAADSVARAALSLVPCHAFAHVVLADNANPQSCGWPGADYDTTWGHALRAVECDSTDGEAFMTLLGEALRRGDRAREYRAYRRMVEERFFSPPVRSYCHWLLAGLPERSVLLVNGDMDTYPTMAVQALEGFRTDVAVVSVALLNMDWYRRLVRDRMGVPMPFGPQALDELQDRDPDGSWVGGSVQVEKGWLDMVRTGQLERPLCYSTTVPMDENADRAASNRVLEGAYYRALPWPPDARIDTARVRTSIAGLSPEDFLGPWVSPRDRSPVRRAHTHLLVGNLVIPALEYAEACDSERHADALAMLDWAVDFSRRARAPDQMLATIMDYRVHVAISHAPGPGKPGNSPSTPSDPRR